MNTRKLLKPSRLQDATVKSLIRGATVAIALTLSVGCSLDTPPDSAPPPPEVETITVSSRTIPDEPVFIGRAEAFRPVEIRAQVSGVIEKIYYTEGRNVKKGDKLYLIDPVPFNAIYQAMKAKVAQHKARLVQTKQNLARVKPLLEEQAVSQKDVDDAVADVLSAEAALEAAQNDVVKAKFDLDNTVVVATVSGRIGRSNFYEGQLISAQTTLLNTIDQLDPMYVSVNVPESYILRRRRELAEKKVERPDLYQLRGVMTFADGSIYPEEGILDFTAVTIRAETGTLQGRFTFPNPSGNFSPGQSNFLPGQFVTVRLKGYHRLNAILIPQRAVQHSANGSFVYVVDDKNKVELRQVHATTWHDNDWLIERGLKSGEKVIVAGFHRVQPGIEVTPVSKNAPENNRDNSGAP
ncbi:MAG: efflux RND transporter periplasmic adaptor subunit [Burkholderiales bacterium]|nr:efflux RND transporter periplasmic adaptor subunit [Burkholderiales bacterium]